MNEKIEGLRSYRPENPEQEEISGALMLANDMLEYRNKIIEAFRDGTYLSKHLKKSDDAAYNYVLENVTNFIQKIESMVKNINLSLFKDFYGSSSPAHYAKMLINTKNPDENKENVAEIEDRISALKDRLKEICKREKKQKCRRGIKDY